jgi:serine/threonine-protein kinase
MKEQPQRPTNAEPTQPIPPSRDDSPSFTPRGTNTDVTQECPSGEDESADPLLARRQDSQTDIDQQSSLMSSDTATPDKPRQEKKVTALGDFRLLKKLGTGGMGSVYKAHQASLDRVVAVKVLARHLAAKETCLQRFKREAKVMARLDHPNILRCFGVGEERGFHYYAMDYADGGSVTAWLRELGRLEVGDALHVALACARALEYAHENNLVHRDIKPDNVLLTSRGVVKLADMGLVKVLEDDLELTESGVGAGTPIYMAPEQARNAKYADARSDIYSLGCMLYHLLTGHLPWTGETSAEVLKSKENEKPQPARRFNPDVPPRLDLILDKMTAREPDLRYQTCAELIADLEGLGLATPALGFFQVTSPSRRSGASSGSVPSVRPPSRPGDESAPPPTAGEAEMGGFWFVSIPNAAGQAIKRKLTLAELRALVEGGDVNAETPTGRALNGPYRALGSYKEFESAMKKQRVEARARSKSEQFRDFYQQIDREERRRRRWRWVRNMFATLGGWVRLLIWLAVLAGAGVGAYYGITYGLKWMNEKGAEYNNREQRSPDAPTK